jgi:hypothetical protein
MEEHCSQDVGNHDTSEIRKEVIFWDYDLCEVKVGIASPVDQVW